MTGCPQGWARRDHSSKLIFNEVEETETAFDPLAGFVPPTAASRLSAQQAPLHLVRSTYIARIDIAPLFPRRHYTRQSGANVPMKFKSLGGFHRPKAGRYRSVFIQMIYAI